MVKPSLIVAICFGMVFLLFPFIGCAPPTQSEMYGTYIADYEIAREKLVLNEDGTYYQEVTLKSSSKTDKAAGTWSYRSYKKDEPASGYITFHENFMFVLDEFGEKLNPGYANPKPGWAVGLPVGRFFRIRIGSGEYVLYKKND